MRRSAVLLLPALLLTGCSAGAAKPDAAPSGSAGIVGLVVQSTDPSHDHVTKRVTYPQTPPVGGPHWPPSAFGATGWLRCGVYDQPVPDEFAVHSEEHGAVWLTYGEGASPADVAALTALTRSSPDYTLVSPYPGQPQAFAASTWGAQLAVTSATDPRLQRFVELYAGGGQGNEKGADCAHGSTPAQAEKALAAAGAGATPAEGTAAAR